MATSLAFILAAADLVFGTLMDGSEGPAVATT